jgi:hypothetical protein
MANIFSDAQLRDKDIDTLKRYLQYKVPGYTVALSFITKKNVLYRGVRWQQRPTNIDDLSYPPHNSVTRFGRVNRIGKPIFYCSVSWEAVFYELRPDLDSRTGFRHREWQKCWRLIKPGR